MQSSVHPRVESSFAALVHVGVIINERRSVVASVAEVPATDVGDVGVSVNFHCRSDIVR